MSNNEVLDRIQYVAKHHSLILDLSELGLSSIPDEIYSLTYLEELILTRNNIQIIPSSIGLLKNLTSLEISANPIRELPKEIGKLEKLKLLGAIRCQLETIPQEIGRLSKLKRLFLGGNSIESLPSTIGELTNLDSLLIPENKLSTLPEKVGNLKSLSVLNLGNNKFSTFPEQILRIQKLGSLYLNNNKLTSLPESIDLLTEIESLNLDNNHISVLPKGIKKLKKLRYLNLKGNPLHIPTEILDQTNSPFSIIASYFGRLGESGTLKNYSHLIRRKPILEAKVVFVGQGSVGKTSLIHQILDGTFDFGQIKTEGISIKQYKVKKLLENEGQNTEIKLNIWDFGGQEIMHATHQFFLTKRSLYILVLDSRLTQEENRVEYWLKIIQSFGGESPVLIVGNKVDQHPLDIDKTGLQKKYSNIVDILETSAATGQGIEKLKTEITKQVDILPHVRDLLPQAWFFVKTNLEEFAKSRNFFTQDQYYDLCRKYDVFDETSQHTLIGFLHDLGVVLHFQDDPRLVNLGILNPQWVTNGVYKILNSHELFQNHGKLTLSLLNQILDLTEYPSNKRLFIVDMMKKFELCYDIEPDKSFLIPDLLPKDLPQLNFSGIPAFEYLYPVLPSSVITRLIVRLNQKIHKNIVWRTGAMLKIGENTALVKADIEDRKISIAIDGLEHTRRDALSAIRYQLDEIHESIKRLNPQKRVPIPEAPNAEPLDYDYLLQLERDGFEEHPVKDGNRLLKVNVRKLLSGVVSESERKQAVRNITNIYGDVSGSNFILGDENQASVKNIEKKKQRKKKS